MEMQDQVECTRSNNFITASNRHFNSCAKLENVVHLKDINSIGDNHTPKARKPYTITKQREKWTEEEHKKFLEALKLYGRCWRQIEEHVGTKSAVQIRSHAQKFFSKVMRESDCSIGSSIKPIDIPPPRPKRKPLHPYPRKSVDSFKEHLRLNETERSPSPNLSATVKDTQSPTSVLSAFGSEALGSAFSEQRNRCLSPNSCTTDIHSVSLSPVEKENDCITSNSSEEEEKGFQVSVPLSTGLSTDLFLKFELTSKETGSFTDDAAKEPHVTGIKLFGRNVSLVNNQKSLNVDKENTKSIVCKSAIVDDVENEKLGQALLSNKLDTQLSLAMSNSNWYTTSDGARGKRMENPKDCFAESGPDAPLRRWSLYQGLPVLNLGACNENLNPTSLRPALNRRMREKESPCTNSNAESVSGMVNGDKNSDAVDSQCRSLHHEGESALHKSPGGFVPYKRCLTERDANTFVGLEERKGQRARVCS